MVKLVLIPKVSLEDFPLDLPSPSASNCGGYILPSAAHSDKTVYAYSPIDLAVAGIEALKRGIIVTDLSLFFYRYRNSIMSIHDIQLGVAHINCDDSSTETVRLDIHSVAYWQSIINNARHGLDVSGLTAILQKNAPLTFTQYE